MKKIKEKKKKDSPGVFVAHYYLLLSALVFAVILLVGYYFVWLPQYNRIFFTDGTDKETKMQLIASKQNQLDQLKLLIANYDRLN